MQKTVKMIHKLGEIIGKAYIWQSLNIEYIENFVNWILREQTIQLENGQNLGHFMKENKRMTNIHKTCSTSLALLKCRSRLCAVLSRSVVSNSLWPDGQGNSPGKNTGVGRHSLSSQPKSPALQTHSLPSAPPEKPKSTGVDSLSLLAGNFQTQELNQGLLHGRQILYQLCYPGSSNFRL